MQFKVLGEGESQRTFIVILAPKKPWLQRLCCKFLFWPKMTVGRAVGYLAA
ncbi:hypothetical protein [Brucella intermedia]|uniref:Uncharacterized protein n=1 Tax=Brucella intermedia TaxID=94625 RepID=A0A7V6U152_9HYPH|nr:hypothetical protein [Brucella intermedia]WGG61252.1 hypothetical protein QA414_21445 [Brucella intermedia]HHV69472.1 hypothetical protein [Brucella intermedia]